MTLAKRSLSATPVESFWQKNQVFITGLLSAIILAVQQIFYNQDPNGIDWKAIGLAALVAIASYIGNAWRGKGVSMAGLIGTVAYALAQILTTGHFTWPQFIAAVIIGLLALVAPPPKPSTYEHNATIVEAKEIPPVDQVLIPKNSKLP